ncbi:MAG: CDP-alcohol phosphatidyltransferase family protein [Nitriliruptorales bacterium]
MSGSPRHDGPRRPGSVFRVGDRGGPEVASDRIVTVPNAISVVRILGLPFAYLDIVGGREGRALVILVVIASSDWLDGYVARRFGQVSRVGQLLDPIVDRLLVAAVGIAMIVSGLLPVWAVALVLARDAVALVGGAVLLRRGAQPPAVTDLGKAATFGLMWALPLFLLAAAVDSAQLRGGAWTIYLGSALLYYLALGQYAAVALSLLRHGDGSSAT